MTMTSRNIVITIDGPAGSGKSSVAKAVALELGLAYLDTGALYRALAYSLDQKGVPPEEGPDLDEALKDVTVSLSSGRVIVDGSDVTDYIRSPEVDGLSSLYSALPSVRERLLDLQREQALSGGLVTDGRDMGTVVFPLAPLKVFLTASIDVRAKRRWKELVSRGKETSLEEVAKDMVSRDKDDTSRACSPLVEPEGSIHLDSSDMTIDQVVSKIVSLSEKARYDG